MEKSSYNKRTDDRCLKRKAEGDDLSNTSTGSPNKRWKSTNFEEPGEPSKNTFSNRRNTTFANDRLKNLRKQLKTDVISISSSINTKILEKPKCNPNSGRSRFEPADVVSKSSFVFNPFNREKCGEAKNVVVPFIKEEPVTSSETEDASYDTVKSTRSYNRGLNSVVPRASASSFFSPRRSPPEQELQISANNRLSKLRSSIHEEGKWKEQKQHKDFDSNLNLTFPPASVSKSSYCNNQITKEPINQDRRNVNEVDNDYAVKRYRCEEPRIPISRLASNNTDVSQGTKACNRYVPKSNCTPTTSKDINLNHKTNTTSLEKHQNVKQDNWNDDKDYSHIVDSLYKKYFENSESHTGTLHKSSNTVNELTESPMDWEDDDVLHPTLNSEEKPQQMESKELHFVVDTNVFIHDLNILQDIINKSKGTIKPIIYLPWMVISELDFIKDDKKSSSDLKNKVQKAVRYINENILGGKSSIKGQTIHEVDEQKYVGKSPDDKILSCCLLVKEKYQRVIFISNDCLLRNKVLINGIPALSTSEILELPYSMTSKEQPTASNKLQEKTQKALEEMSTCCSLIICECAKEAYGRVWNKMSMLSNPPWSLKICLKIFRKYWRGIFHEKFLKQFMQSVEKLEEAHKALETNKTSKNFDALVAAYLGICFYFKDLEEHKAFVETSIKDVKSIAYMD